MTSLLRIDGLTRNIEHKEILSDTDFEVLQGQCVLLTAPNGSGKTTLLRIIAGIDLPDAGEITWHGRCVNSKRYRRTIRNKVIYLHQSPYIYDRTVEENLSMVTDGILWQKRSTTEEIEKALSFARLLTMRKQNARTLSGGEKQRLALARAWLLKPEIMLLDEPTANMDEDSVAGTLTMLKKLKASGVTLICSNHQKNQFEEITDCSMTIENRKICMLKTCIGSEKTVISQEFGGVSANA